MTDNTIINEAVKLVADGYSVTLPVTGRSMLPFIIGGRESVILAQPDNLRRGLVALAWIEGRRFVLHRIESIDGDRVTLMGDGNLVEREHCLINDIKAIATHVVDSKGRRHDLYSPMRSMAVRAWTTAIPIRRWLLILYRITH